MKPLAVVLLCGVLLGCANTHRDDYITTRDERETYKALYGTPTSIVLVDQGGLWEETHEFRCAGKLAVFGRNTWTEIKGEGDKLGFRYTEIKKHYSDYYLTSISSIASSACP